MARHFDLGDAGPFMVVAFQPDGGFDTREGRQRIPDLTRELYLDGVAASGVFPIRWAIPAGQIRPVRSQLVAEDGRQPAPADPRALRGDGTGLCGRCDATGFDPESRPFLRGSGRNAETSRRVAADDRDYADSPWHNATFVFSGMAADLRDLERVTQSDNLRIQILVVLAVLAVLLVILRRPLVCLYLIVTVLFSYYVTMGVTDWFFAWLYGPDSRAWTGKCRCSCS